MADFQNLLLRFCQKLAVCAFVCENLVPCHQPVSFIYLSTGGQVFRFAEGMSWLVNPLPSINPLHTLLPGLYPAPALLIVRDDVRVHQFYGAIHESQG